MKIRIKGEGRNLTLLFPTALLFSRGTAWLANTVGRQYAGEAMKDIPPEAMQAVFAELRRVKRKYGSWELVEAVSADGNRVNIVL